MSERDESRPVALRPVELLRPHGDLDPTARLRDTLGVLDAKLRGAEGVDGVVTWLRRAERIVAAISSEEVERTRREIRELIEKLLALNAQVQSIARLKQLLS
jgi:hypothetical protein